MQEIISVHDVWEPLKQVLLASRDVIISSQIICVSKFQRFFHISKHQRFPEWSWRSFWRHRWRTSGKFGRDFRASFAGKIFRSIFHQNSTANFTVKLHYEVLGCGGPYIRWRMLAAHKEGRASQARKRAQILSFWVRRDPGWGGGLPLEGVGVEKLVPSLESLPSLGLEGRNLGCPRKFARMSLDPQGCSKSFVPQKIVFIFRSLRLSHGG